MNLNAKVEFCPHIGMFLTNNSGLYMKTGVGTHPNTQTFPSSQW